MSYKVIRNYVQKNKYGIKCPYEMTPKYITVHNTDNDAPAENEVAYMRRNNLQTSFHVAIDDKHVVYGVPLNRNAWHAGDGNGKGNRQSIGVEICYSKSGGKRFDEAEKNAAKWIAKELKSRGWGIDRVKRHKDWSGKNCPKRTMAKGWDRFLNMVKTELKKSGKDEKLPKPTNLEKKVKVTASCLNIRRGPSVKHVIVGCIIDKGIYTIVETKNGWGKLKSGAGWICLKCTKEIK